MGAQQCVSKADGVWDSAVGGAVCKDEADAKVARRPCPLGTTSHLLCDDEEPEEERKTHPPRALRAKAVRRPCLLANDTSCHFTHARELEEERKSEPSEAPGANATHRPCLPTKTSRFGDEDGETDEDDGGNTLAAGPQSSTAVVADASTLGQEARHDLSLGRVFSVQDTAEKFDWIMSRVEALLEALIASPSSSVKISRLVIELLRYIEEARAFMLSCLVVRDCDRSTLTELFGGDCARISRCHSLLTTAKPILGVRVNGSLHACESVEKVLQDLGLSASLRAAKRVASQQLEKRLEEWRPHVAPTLDGREVDCTTIHRAHEEQEASHEKRCAEVEAMAIAVRPKVKRPKRFAFALPSEDEALASEIIQLTDLDEVRRREPHQTERPHLWQIWIVHRASLDDPELTKVDFMNRTMPSGREEPRIARRLVEVLARNSNVTHLLLANSGLRSREGVALGKALAHNKQLRVLNLDSNLLDAAALCEVAAGCLTCRALEEVRVNNQRISDVDSRQVMDAFAYLVANNLMIRKLGLEVSVHVVRVELEQALLRNNDLARQERLMKSAEQESGSVD